MKRLSAALLAIGLAASGSAFAQSSYYPSDDGYYGNVSDNGAYNGGQQGNAYYDYARVIRVDPVIGGYRSTANYGGQRCYETRSAGGYTRDGYENGYTGNDGYYRNDPYRNDPYGRSQYGGSTAGRNVATVVGGIAGAVLGSKIGGGTGTYAATAIGSMVGGMAGRQVYENTQRDRYAPGGTVTVCDPVPAGRGDAYGYNRTNDGRASAYDVTYEYNGRQYTRRMSYHPGDRVRVRVDVAPQ
jgi:hypothetical protein